MQIAKNEQICNAFLFSIICFWQLSSANAELVINGNFSTGQFAQPGDSNYRVFGPGFEGTLILPGQTALAGWQVSFSPFDIDQTFTPGVIIDPAFGLEWTNQSTFSNQRWIDLKRAADSWRVSQALSTLPGQNYLLSYQVLAGNQEGGAVSRIELAGNSTFAFEDTSSALSSPFWQTFTHPFVASSSSTLLSIMAKSSGLDPFTGPQIDNVSVTAVPEPPSLILLIVFIIGAIAFCRGPGCLGKSIDIAK